LNGILIDIPENKISLYGPRAYIAFGLSLTGSRFDIN